LVAGRRNIPILRLVELAIPLFYGSNPSSWRHRDASGRWSPEGNRIHIFPESARGTAEGFRQYDLRPNSTMTNATVTSSA
jgi:hypothetical protein